MIPSVDRLRNKEDRAFRQEVLDKLTKKEEPAWAFMNTRAWALLNSSFALWFLSAAVLASGSALYAGYQNCKADAEKLIDSFQRYHDEMHFRHSHIFTLVIGAKNIEEIQSGLNNIPVRDFEKQPTVTIAKTLQPIYKKIDLKPINEALKSLPRADRSMIDHPHYKREFGDLLDGRLPPTVEARDLGELKEYAQAHKENAVNNENRWSFVTLKPACSFRKVIKANVFGSDIKIVEGEALVSLN